MDFGAVILSIFFLELFFCVAPAAKHCAKEVKCAIGRTRNFRSVDCYNRDLSEIPKCLPYDSEVIELSHNRIRKISKTDLSNYPYVKYLYLYDNAIQSIDLEAFTDLKYLETLDLSVNSMHELPPVIFRLPSLKVLYLRQNWNINIVDAVEKAKPILSPLTKLDVSVITEDGQDTTYFPDFGELPLLVFMNISYNKFARLTPRHFAGLCNIQFLINENVTVEDYDDPCDCWRINDWLSDRKVNFNSTLPCDIAKKACKNLTISYEDMTIFKKCRGTLEQIEKSELWAKIGIWIGGILGVILLLAGIVILYIKCNKPNQTARTTKKSVPDGFSIRSNQVSSGPEVQLLGNNQARI